jgi:hypothetical protein
LIETNTFDPNWLAGFVSGEGCFYITIFNSSTTKSGVQVLLAFQLTQDIRDADLINSLKSYLDCGRIKTTSRDKSSWIDLVVTKFSDIEGKIIPLFEKYNLLGVKSQDFDLWCTGAKLFKNKKHLTPQGLQDMRDLQTKMRD